MAKKDATGNVAESANTEKKTMVKRSTEELKKSEKGKIVVVLRAAMSLANVKERDGLTSIVIEPKDEAGKAKTKDQIAKEGAKVLAGRMNLIMREGGKLTLIDEKDENYTKLKAHAQKALPELQKSNYGTNVKALLNFCLDTMSVGTGKRGFNPGSLEGLSL